MFGLLRKEITPDLKTIPLLKDVSQRAMRSAGKEARWFALPAGQPLFLAGEPADSIYFVLSGALGAFGAKGEFVGHIRPGEPVGEMALFLGGVGSNTEGEGQDRPHSGSVYALRDSEVIALSRAGWKLLVKSEPELLEGMIRIILRRLGRGDQRTGEAAPKVYTLLSTSPTIDLGLRARALKSALARFGKRAVIVEETEGSEKPAAFFDQLETEYDAVILIAAIGDTPWFRLSTRQADRIWVLARSDARPSTPLMPEDTSPAQRLKLIDIVLIHPGAERRASRPQEWLQAAGAKRLFHWQGDNGADAMRLARIMTGRSVGLVLSGGGARAYSHIGAIRAIRELGIPIDFAGGASMGAVVAACVAIGWSDEEIDRRIRKAFVETNPLGDYTLPVVGMVKGKRVNQRLQEHFGEIDIGDLQIPFFALSTNLTDGQAKLHRCGLLRTALRATISLPGILPPFVEGEDILVDGAVLDNFPVESMRELHQGFVIGSDVSAIRDGLNREEFVHPENFWQWVFKRGFSSPPPIAGLLMRAATIRDDRLTPRDKADILILPELPDIELRDWKAYEASVEAGYKAAMDALKGHEILSLCCPA
ncbi:cyclic nucleotide-binding/patatin-like phospholipase domain-containing protein [Hyphomonas polymorpha PS728]|uniref:Cyclic nucleotide-binding/patatin-like phospholipase domain-containing protein n=1 Tax=Hyphomonas polymorpha PS728 TaxID=1280954 RepID=A0A062VJV8_9PROT|nr:patatin-like phospholipase family protein [Hyphomonas polymorpha]KCZ98863.1 cyclic nucleotide-binding/patatin-like phospholipase domain-containing protein [Hyphomonas polymorpha PS728]